MRDPVFFSDEIAEKILARLAEGETLNAICRSEGYPSTMAVRKWAMKDPDGFGSQYAQARELGAYVWVDQTIDISDETGEDVARARLRVDTRKWLASRILPAAFGDKPDKAPNGDAAGTVTQYELPSNGR